MEEGGSLSGFSRRPFTLVSPLKGTSRATTVKTFPCDLCDKLSASEADQKALMKFLNMERSFKCEQFGKWFKK